MSRFDSIGDVLASFESSGRIEAELSKARMHLQDALRQVNACSPRLAMIQTLKANGALLRASTIQAEYEARKP